MRNHGGFIQIPLLIAIIAGVLIFGGLGYFGFTQYQARQGQNDKTEELLQQQQQALEDAQREIEALKEQNEEVQNKQQALEQQAPKQENLKVSSTYIAERSALLHCLQIEGAESEIRLLYDVPVYEPATEGSSVFISSRGEILTNAHVVGVAPLCLVQTAKAPNYSVPSPSFFARVTAVNENLDIAKLQIISDVDGNPITSSFKYFTVADQTSTTGQKVFVAGFSTASNKRLAITEGIVSGYDDISGYIQGAYLITSAKIDSGNSGGAALTAEGELIGLPTFLRGNYESLGYILDLNRAKGQFSF